MSKAFTKDDDATDPIAIVAPRAPLPAGTPNYTTTRGLLALRAELAALHEARAKAAPGDRAALGARMQELDERIARAVVVDPRAQPHDEVRFGALVTLRTEDGAERRYQIVGVDEADVAHGRVAFVAPLARALLGKRVGDVAVLRAPSGEEELEVAGIAYPDER
jgi:transcription elongation factor GreB